MRTITNRLALIALASLCAAGTARADGQYQQTNLIADKSGMGAQVVDPDLIDPWGISMSGTSPFWVSNQGAGGAGSTQHGTSTLYTVLASSGGLTATKVTALTVTIPNNGGAAPSFGNGPSGQVSTGQVGLIVNTNDFPVGGNKASFIFANLDGSISAWNGGTSSTIVVPKATTNTPSYAGLAIGNGTVNGVAGAYIYAADQNSTNVDIYNSSWAKVGTLTDPNLPANFKAFNVQNINGVLYVTYAIPGVHDGGVVDTYSTNGTLLGRLITDTNGTHLQTPWGIALAPSNFGALSNDLLIGNNDGDGTINAYTTGGTWVGQLKLPDGSVFSQAELWGLTFGNGGSGGAKNILYFAAGLPGATDGLFGALASVPEPGSAVLGLIAAGTLAAGWRWKSRRRAATSSGM
jgi:uncharacterized protein (TIGR03118 family)